MAPTVAFAADTSVSGGISWNITDGTLTISAADIPEDGYTKGVMPNYAYGKQPWNSNKSNIQSIVIKAEVTNIRERAFQDTKVTAHSSAPIRKSPAKADFRIVTTHHPFDDDLTRKYIPSIVESGNVNVMFSGHTHLYARYASANPARGTDTLYVTQGDARIGDGKIDTGKPDQRMDDNYPNLLANGKSDMLEVTVKDGLLTYKNMGLGSEGEITLSKDGTKLAYSDISITPNSIQSNGTVTVSATVTNVGKGLAAASMRVKDNGADRPELTRMMEYVRRGDTVIVESISRFARNTRDLLDLLERLTEKQVEFVSRKEAIDTTTPTGKFMLTVFAAVAELEREYILQRQHEGIAIAKEQGKYTGRKPRPLPDNFERVVARWRAGEITAVEAMRQTELKPNTRRCEFRPIHFSAR